MTITTPEILLSSGVSKLSELEIDADKDWESYKISNMVLNSADIKLDTDNLEDFIIIMSILM